MKRIILFSNPLEVIEKIEKLIFPTEFKGKKTAYMPANGIFKQVHYEYWREIANRNNVEFIYINNFSLNPQEEIEKLMNCNILLITGGKLTLCTNNIRKSGLDKSILDFLKKDEYIYAGFSAGAMILTRSINLAGHGKCRETIIKLDDMQGLGVVDYEILQHYVPEENDESLEEYRNSTPHKVRTIKDDEYILIEDRKETYV